MASLSLTGIVKRYAGSDVLKGIDLAVADGEFLVLVGPSGCGKSTLLNIIAGLDTADRGGVAIGGLDVGAVPPSDRNIAMVFQSYALYPGMTVRQNIVFGMEVRKVPKAERERATQDVAQILQIEALLDRKISQLSGGQRQRVAMGRALVRKPAVFLFDEPLSNLDAKLRVEMRTEIKKLHHRLGSTIVYVTHDQIEAMTLATRIAIMRGGRIEQLAPPRVLYEQPANMFVAGFIGSPPMNFIPAELEGIGDGVVAVLRGAGAPVRLPLAVPRSAVAARLGRPVVLGVRPEHLTPASAGRPGAFTVPVEVVEPTGADTMVVVGLGGKDVIARVPPELAKAPGQSMVFSVDGARLSLFDPESELRLG